MRYKVMLKSDIVAEFETAQGAGDYLFTIPAEKITEFYIHDTKENAAFPYCTYKYEWGSLVGTHHTTFSDVIKTLKQGGMTMLYDHSTKAQRAMNAELRKMTRTVMLPGSRLYMLQTSDGVKLYGPTSKKNIDEWINLQYPVDSDDNK